MGRSRFIRSSAWWGRFLRIEVAVGSTGSDQTSEIHLYRPVGIESFLLGQARLHRGVDDFSFRGLLVGGADNKGGEKGKVVTEMGKMRKKFLFTRDFVEENGGKNVEGEREGKREEGARLIFAGKDSSGRFKIKSDGSPST